MNELLDEVRDRSSLGMFAACLLNCLLTFGALLDGIEPLLNLALRLGVHFMDIGEGEALLAVFAEHHDLGDAIALVAKSEANGAARVYPHHQPAPVRNGHVIAFLGRFTTIEPGCGDAHESWCTPSKEWLSGVHLGDTLRVSSFRNPLVTAL